MHDSNISPDLKILVREINCEAGDNNALGCGPPNALELAKETTNIRIVNLNGE